jgi:hypothetical protein
MRRFLALVVLSGCGSSPGSSADGGTGDGGTDGAIALELPPVNAKADYQLGGAYPPPSGVTVVVRDRKATRAEGLYNICYVNGFQVQPDDESYWLDLHPDLLLRDGGGDIVRDPAWNEMLLDIRLAEKRTAIASIVGSWIRECVQNSYDAVEIDNLDSFTRSQGLLLENQAVLTMKMLAEHAHQAGVPIAQKNAAELVARRAEMSTDFAVAEECNRYSECDTYTGGYGDHVIVIEYRQQDFAAGCAAYPNLSIVLRDVELVTPQSAGYVYDGC